MDMLFSFSLFFLCCYVVLLLLLLFYWHSIPPFQLPYVNNHNKDKLNKNVSNHLDNVLHEENIGIHISVIVAIRNEAENIKNLINSLLAQNYLKKNLQIILVNDHSTDVTVELIQTHIALDKHFLFLELPTHVRGKKQAITYAIQHAKGKLIVTTDADCIFHPNWLLTIYNFYQQKQAKLISAGVKMLPQREQEKRQNQTESKQQNREQNLLDIFQILDFSTLIGVGAACIAMQKPTMCNGANLAYTKEVFEEFGGFEGNEHLASGDDEFLLQKIATKYPNDIHFLKNKEAIVSTTTQQTWKDFFQQRKRWASKWNLHKQWQTQTLALFIFVFHLTALLLPLFVYFGKISITQMLFFLGVKMCIEFIFVGSFLQFLQLTHYIIFIPFIGILYPCYAFIMGIAANFKGFEWKQRQY
jgi:biofilm PGA synthesis N-glycosyltransferase PgaC